MTYRNIKRDFASTPFVLKALSLSDKSACAGVCKMSTILLLMMFMFTCPYAADQPQDTARVFSDLQSCINKARSSFTSGDESKLVKEIEKSFDLIKTKWRGQGSKDLSEDYLKSLSYDCQLLTEALQETDTRAANLLESVKKDLAVKVKHSRNGVNASEDLDGKIQVIVKTLRNGQEVNGYLVRCNQELFRDSKTPLFVFNDQTSPSIRLLPPGYYKLWIENGDGVVIKTRPLMIGDDERSAITVKIEVPEL